MVKELLENLAGRGADDYWYDVQSECVENALRSFSKSNWITLRENLPSSDKQVNILLLECLGNVQNHYALSCIEKIAVHGDLDILFDCALAIRSFELDSISGEFKKLLIENEMLLLENRPKNMAKIVSELILEMKTD